MKLSETRCAVAKPTAQRQVKGGRKGCSVLDGSGASSKQRHCAGFLEGLAE